MSMLVAADNVTFTNCTFTQGVTVAGNNVTFTNCTAKAFDAVPVSVATLDDCITILNASGVSSWSVSDFPAIANSSAASLTLDGGTYDNQVNGLSGTLTITGNGTYTNSVLIENSPTTIENGTFTGPVVTAAAAGNTGFTGTLKINGGLFTYKLAGWTEDSNVYKIQAPETTFDSTSHTSFKNQYESFYVATNTGFEPTMKMVYNGADGSHKIATWRLEMTNTAEGYHKAGYADETDYANKLSLAGYSANEALTEISFKCIDNYKGYKPIHGDIQLAPVYAMNASDLTFTAPSGDQEATVTSKLADAPALTLSYYNVADKTTSDTYPTKAGTYQVKATPAETKYFAADGTYYKATAGEEFTDESWQFTITAGINADGKPTVSETDNWTYDAEDDTLTVKAEGELDLGDTTLTTDVTNNGTIESGTFTGTVTGGTINGGVFATAPTEATIPSKAEVTVTGGATVNGLENDGTDTVTVVTGKPQTIKLAAEIKDHELIGWKATEGDGEPTLTEGSKVTIQQGDTTARIFTPVVQVIKSDLEMLRVTASDESEAKYYLLDAAGKPTGEGFDVLPEDAGTYAKFIELTLPTTDEENDIALYAADVTLDRVLENGGIGYYVPELLQVSDSVKVGSDDTSSSSKDDDVSGAAIAVAAVAGTAAVGTIAYFAGTQAYLNKALPAGTAIPTNRQQLADLLWTAAGKPEPAGTQLFTDISAEAVDSQKAALWCTEQGLMQAEGSTFKPAKHAFRLQVIKAWNQLQANQKAE